MSRFSKVTITLILTLTLIIPGTISVYAGDANSAFAYTSKNVTTSNATLTKINVDGIENIAFSESGKRAFPESGTATKTEIANSKKAARVVYYYAVYLDQANTNAQRLKLQYALTYIHKGASAVPSTKLATAKSMVSTASKHIIPDYMHFKAYRFKAVEPYKNQYPTFIAYEYDLKKPIIGLTYYNKKSFKAIEKFGGEPVLLDEITTKKGAAKCVEKYDIDALLVPGGIKVCPSTYGQKSLDNSGIGSPMRDRIDMHYISVAFDNDMPILAFCRGIQILNVAAGGTLNQNIVKQGITKTSHKHTFHYMKPVEGRLLAKIVGTGRLYVRSNHSASIKKLGKGAKIAGKSPDGIIEAIYFPKMTFALGLQFHPEKEDTVDTLYSYRIFTKYLNAANAYREKKPNEAESDDVIE